MEIHYLWISIFEKLPLFQALGEAGTETDVSQYAIQIMNEIPILPICCYSFLFLKYVQWYI